MFTHAISGEAPLPRKWDLATRKPASHQPNWASSGRAQGNRGGHGPWWPLEVPCPCWASRVTDPGAPQAGPHVGPEGVFLPTCLSSSPQPLTYPQKAGCLFTLVTPRPQRPARGLAHSRCSVSVCGRGGGLGVHLTVQALHSMGAPRRQWEGAGPVSGSQLGGCSHCLGQMCAGHEPAPVTCSWLSAQLHVL